MVLNLLRPVEKPFSRRSQSLDERERVSVRVDASVSEVGVEWSNGKKTVQYTL